MALILNDYQRQFIQCLTASGVRFIVIGGQARAFHYRTPTRDLDIWADIVESQQPRLREALLAWGERYPAHTYPELKPSLPLRSGMQQKLPATDGCWYMRDDREIAEIGPEDGVDLLTSIEGADFEELYDRGAVTRLDDGVLGRVLSADDLDRMPRKG